MGLAKAVGVSNYNEKRLRRAHGIIEIVSLPPHIIPVLTFALHIHTQLVQGSILSRTGDCLNRLDAGPGRPGTALSRTVSPVLLREWHQKLLPATCLCKYMLRMTCVQVYSSKRTAASFLTLF